MSKQTVAAKVNKRVFEVADGGEGDAPLKLEVRRPDQKALQAAQKANSKAFKDAVESGALLRPAVEKYMRQQNLWDDEMQAKYTGLWKTIREGEKKLSLGGIKLSEAKTIAFAMQDARAELQDLMSQRNVIDAYTAEAQAENARFNHLVSVCTRYASDGKPFFKDYEDYLSRQDEEASVKAASEYAKLEYGVDDDWQKSLSETKFLIKNRLADEKGRLIDKDKNLIDRQGRRVDEEGFLTDERGRRVDLEGTPVNEDGTYDVEFTPFIDDLGAIAPQTPREGEGPNADSPQKPLEAKAEHSLAA